MPAAEYSARSQTPFTFLFLNVHHFWRVLKIFVEEIAGTASSSFETSDTFLSKLPASGCCRLTNDANTHLSLPFAGQFTEDGSFIGQYVPGKLNPPVSPQPIHHQAGSSSAATYV